MKLLIFSDSHGNVANMEDAVRLERPDRILHLGDLVRDARALQEKFPDIPVTLVPGNCDGCRPDLPEERVFTLEGCRLMMTHGHTYQVKATAALAVRAARAAGAQLLFFGHTHEALCQFEGGLWVVNPGSAGSLARPTYAVAVLAGDGAVCYLQG